MEKQCSNITSSGENNVNSCLCCTYIENSPIHGNLNKLR